MTNVAPLPPPLTQTSVMSTPGDDHDVFDPHLRSKVLVQFWFDVDQIADYDYKTIVCSVLTTFIVPMIGCIVGPILCCCQLGCAKANTRDAARAVHVVLTEDSIVYKIDQRKSGCRCDACDQPTTSNIIQLKNVVDVRVTHPAGGCCIRNVLSVVHIDTAGGPGTEMTLRGLVDAEFFRRCIFAQV
jgi:hypothetical protein